MYRIELSPGEETAFRSIEELAVAIRRGVVTPRARIYHNATHKWLPIQFHPHYKQAVSMPLTQADLVAGPSAKPRTSLNLSEPAPHAAAALKEPAPQLPSSSMRDSAVQAALAAWGPAKPLSTVAPPKASEPKPAASAPARQALPPEFPRPLAPEFPKPLAPELPRALASELPRPLASESSREKRGGSKRKRTKRALRLALAGALLIASTHLVVGPAGVRLAAFPSAAGVAPSLPIISVPDPSVILHHSRPEVAPVKKTLEREASAPVTERIPAPEPTPRTAAPPAPTPSQADSSTIAPAPTAIDLSIPGAVRTESLVPKIVDSTSKKSLKGILRAINGAPVRENAKPRR